MGHPIDDDYMGPRQLAYFRQKLLDWRSTLLAEADATLTELRDDSHHEVGDEADRASREAAQTLELRTRDRYRKLLGKIDVPSLASTTAAMGGARIPASPSAWRGSKPAQSRRSA